MKPDTQRRISRLQMELIQTRERIRGIHNDAYSVSDTETMMMTSPAMEQLEAIKKVVSDFLKRRS